MGWEKWRLFVYVAASEYHVISKEVENCFKHNHIFRQCRYTLIDSFYVFFLFFAVILSELHEKPRRKYWVTEKTAWINLSEQHYFLAGTPSCLCFFFLFVFCLLAPFLSTLILCRKSFSFAPENIVCGWEFGVFCLLSPFLGICSPDILNDVREMK